MVEVRHGVGVVYRLDFTCCVHLASMYTHIHKHTMQVDSVPDVSLSHTPWQVLDQVHHTQLSGAMRLMQRLVVVEASWQLLWAMSAWRESIESNKVLRQHDKTAEELHKVRMC